EFGPQSIPRDAQQLTRLNLAPFDVAEDRAHDNPVYRQANLRVDVRLPGPEQLVNELGDVQRPGVGAGWWLGWQRCAGMEDFRQALRRQDLAGRVDEGVLDRVLQLAYIARPIMLFQQAQSLGRHRANLFPHRPVEGLDKVLDQQRHVVEPLPERG